MNSRHLEQEAGGRWQVAEGVESTAVRLPPPTCHLPPFGVGATVRWRTRVVLGAVMVAMAACVQYISPPTEAPLAQRLAAVEGLYADARDLWFKAYVTRANGTGKSAKGIPLAELEGTYTALRERALERLDALDPASLGEGDRRAYAVMKSTLTADSLAKSQPSPAVDCRYDVAELARVGAGVLGARIYRCYGRAQSRVVTASDTADRLSVLARLGTDSSAVRRRALFVSLRPVWESVNGTNTPESPWRTLIGLQAARWRSDAPIDAAARSLGMDPATVEPVLEQVLEAWRRQQPAALVEPWDWYYANGAASRRLSKRAPTRELERTTESYYASFGASPRELGVTYDLGPREGKTPVAFTQFGGIPRRTRDGTRGADPFVFATYREGGLGNLVELLHETGHAIHIAGVETRPAFADWPDSDPFTEALADVPALEAYEGPWQVKYLGDSARTAESLREKYGSVMMDVAWALFEMRMRRDPSQDPNVTWTGITERYLRIAPHPEWSWWAMRGQLIESPGYMMNYALGALVVAEVRAQVKKEKGGFLTGGPRLYAWLSDHLYRYGRERPAREVLETFLGHRPGPEAIVRDIERMGTGG